MRRLPQNRPIHRSRTRRAASRRPDPAVRGRAWRRPHTEAVLRRASARKPRRGRPCARSDVAVAEDFSRSDAIALFESASSASRRDLVLEGSSPCCRSMPDPRGIEMLLPPHTTRRRATLRQLVHEVGRSGHRGYQVMRLTCARIVSVPGACRSCCWCGENHEVRPPLIELGRGRARRQAGARRQSGAQPARSTAARNRATASACPFLRQECRSR